MERSAEKTFITYIETPRQISRPLPIDVLLEQRMKAFMRARRMRRFNLNCQ